MLLLILTRAANTKRPTRLDDRIQEILLKAGVDQYHPDWDMITTDLSAGIIEVYHGNDLLKTINVLEARRQAA